MAARIDAWTLRRPRRLFLAGALCALLIPMHYSGNDGSVSPASADFELQRKEDIHNLYYAAVAAKWSDAPRWFVGPWIYPEVPYYRPLTSVLYLAEYRLFGKDFGAYNAVTLALHGVNAVLVYLLVSSLFASRPRARVALGLAGVWYFASPVSSMGFGVSKALSWWPAQNDVLSLLFCLLCLVLLDRYLMRTSGRGGWLFAGSMFAFILSVCSKEMGYITGPIAVTLCAHRQRRISWEMAAITVLTAGLWVYRLVVVPGAWHPVMFRMVIVRKAMLSWGGPIFAHAVVGDWWILSAAAVTLILVAYGLRRRWPVYGIAGATLAACMLCAQLLSEGGTWFLMFEQWAQISYVKLVIYLFGIILSLRYWRSEPALFASLALGLAYLPILQYGGHHYFYWIAGFLGIADAAFIACLARWLQEIRPNLNWGRLPAAIDAVKADFAKPVPATREMADESLPVS